MVVVKFFSQNRVQQRRLLLWNACLSGLWSRSSTFLLLVLALDRDLPLPLLLVLQKTILLGFFALFPWKKVRSAGQVSANLLQHVSSWTPAAYEQSMGFHEQESKEEEEQRRKAKEVRKLEVTALLTVPMALRTQAQQRRIMELSDEVDAETHPKRRKRKKRRKRRTPRTSLRGRARRRQRPEMPCIMAGMYLKDRCSGLIKAGIDGYVAPRAVFPSLVCRPRILCILAGTDLKDSCSGMYKAGFSGVSAPRAVLPEAYRKIGLFVRWRVFFFGPCIWKSLVRAFAFGVQGCLFPGDAPGMVSVFSTLLGSTADTCSASVYEVF